MPPPTSALQPRSSRLPPGSARAAEKFGQPLPEESGAGLGERNSLSDAAVVVDLHEVNASGEKRWRRYRLTPNGQGDQRGR